MSNSLFGTDGIRGTVGTFPFTSEHLTRLGCSIGRWVINKYGPQATILIGHDTRISCSLVKAALEAGLLKYPCTLHDAGVLSTPGICATAHNDQQYSCALIISASHNPYQDNGIKVIDARRGKLSSEDEQLITDYFYSHEEPANYQSLGTSQALTNSEDSYLALVKCSIAHLAIGDKKVIIDCANGATASLAPAVFKEYGINFVAINNKPSGLNINAQCGSTHPATIVTAVQENNADIGFAFDGDGDRIIAVNRTGQVKDGDDILALLASHPAYKNTAAVVGTILSNCGLEVYLKQQSKKLIRARVGDKHVAQELEKNNLLLGGEPSGHIVLRDHLFTGDGIFTALRLLEMAAITNNWDLVSFEKYPQATINLPITNKKELTQEPCASIIAQHEKKLQAGRIIVRYSGTEPLLRIVVEDASRDHARTVGNSLAQELKRVLS